MKNIAIIERPEHIDAALEHFLPYETVFIAASAQASCELQRRAISFTCDEDVLSPEEFKKIGSDDFGLTESIVSRLDEALGEKYPVFKERSFRPFRWNFYRIKIMLDAVRSRKMILDALIRREKPVCIGAPSFAAPGETHDHHLFFNLSDSLYGLLADRTAKKEHINVQRWPAGPFVADRMGKSLSIVPRSIRNAAAGIRKIGKVPFAKRGAPNILYGVLDYDIVDLVKAMSKEANFYSYENTGSIRFLSSPFCCRSQGRPLPFRKLDTKSLFSGVGTISDDIVDDIIMTRLASYAQRYIPVLWSALNRMDEVDSSKGFKTYIHHAGASDALSAIPLYYFQDRKKPVVIVQHGGYGYAKNAQVEYCEFDHNGYFLAWGEGVADMYGDRGSGKCRIKPAGSHGAGLIANGRKVRSRIRKVCYIPGSYRGYTAYFSGGQLALDSKVFGMESRFLSALRPYRGRYDFTYKAAPRSVRSSHLFGDSPMPDWIERNMPWMKVETAPLSSVIHDFDMFIIDFPTTVLIHSLASGAEVAVYAGNPYYVISEDALKLLKRRAVVGMDETDFIEKVCSVLESGKTVSDIADTAFLERYGTYKNDGRSLERIVAAVRAVI